LPSTPRRRTSDEPSSIASACEALRAAHRRVRNGSAQLGTMSRRRPKPSPVVIRRIDSPEVVDIVPAENFPRAKTLADYAFAGMHVEAITPWELIEEQELLALSRFAPVALDDDADQLVWFVIDVDGPKRGMVVGTVMFDQPHQRTVPFDVGHPIQLSAQDEADARRAVQILKQQP
jgi:hypothetical protein